MVGWMVGLRAFWMVVSMDQRKAERWADLLVVQ